MRPVLRRRALGALAAAALVLGPPSCGRPEDDPAGAVPAVEAPSGRPGQTPITFEETNMEDLPQQAREHLEEAAKVLEALIAGLDDESRPAMERLASVAKEGAVIEKHLQAVMEAGVAQDHPAVRKVLARGDVIGSKLEALRDAGAKEVAAPQPVTAEEELGREAAGIERETLAAVAELLADRPPAEEVLAQVRELHDEGIRRAHEMSKRRAALDDKGRRNFQWGLLNATKENREVRSAIGDELWRHYVGTPVAPVLEELLDVARYIEPDRLTGAHHAHLERLGLR